MDTVTFNQTVPAVCRVVCTLVAAGISGSFNVPNLVSTPQAQPASLPDGYIGYPDVGAAYKVHDEIVTWIEARSRCIKEGAQLARIDTLKKLGYVKRQKNERDWAFVGIIHLYDDTTWVALTTGLPVTALPWAPGFPQSNGDCVLIGFVENGLGNHPCTHEHNYVCELPIIEKEKIAAN